MADATIPESHRDLMNANQTVVVATVGPNGQPQLTATWFLVDEQGRVRLSINTSRQKAKNLRSDPAITLFFYDPASPYRTLEIRGHAEIADDPNYALAGQVSAKYNSDLRQMDKPGETRIDVTVVPDRVNTFG